MKTPLSYIRVLLSESEALHRGQQFDTIADFDATVRAAAAPPSGGRVAYVVVWKDGSRFHGRVDLGQPFGDGLVEHVGRACRDVLEDPRLDTLRSGLKLIAVRLFETALAEKLAGKTYPSSRQEVACLRA